MEDRRKVHCQLRVMPAQPLLRPFRLRTDALHREPELGGVVRDAQMHHLVRNEIAEYEIRRKDETPVGLEVSPG